MRKEEGNRQLAVKLKTTRLANPGISAPGPGGLLLAADVTLSPPGGMNHG